jgi:hypothetical protein
MLRWYPLALALLSILTRLSQSTFQLQLPPTIGYDDKAEDTSPCGSFTANTAEANVTDFYVGGDAVSINTANSESSFLVRATLDVNAGGSWLVVVPPFVEDGFGDFCFPQVVIPSSWSGSYGVIQIIQDAGVEINFQVRLHCQCV